MTKEIKDLWNDKGVIGRNIIDGVTAASLLVAGFGNYMWATHAPHGLYVYKLLVGASVVIGLMGGWVLVAFLRNKEVK
jgi:hypothetical protein